MSELDELPPLRMRQSRLLPRPREPTGPAYQLCEVRQYRLSTVPPRARTAGFIDHPNSSRLPRCPRRTLIPWSPLTWSAR